jgi:methylglutaconyl-CoA hydratase
MRSGDSLLYEVREAVARVTLNRPEKRNALDPDLIGALENGLRKAEADPDVRVITLEGAGSDFCAGADLAALREMLDRPALENLEDAENLGRLFLRIRRGRKPVLALVRGRALAGGCGLATACDLILATEAARFGYTEVRIGFVPALVMAILARNVTEKRAFEMIATGDIYSAADFHRFGLVNRVWPEERFEAEARDFVLGLARQDPDALRLGKALLYRQDELSFDAAIRTGAEINTIARMTEGLRKGVDRFFEQRARHGD